MCDSMYRTRGLENWEWRNDLEVPTRHQRLRRAPTPHQTLSAPLRPTNSSPTTSNPPRARCVRDLCSPRSIPLLHFTSSQPTPSRLFRAPRLLPSPRHRPRFTVARFLSVRIWKRGEYLSAWASCHMYGFWAGGVSEEWVRGR